MPHTPLTKNFLAEWSSIPDDLRKPLKGQALTERLDHLAATANEQAHAAKQTWRSTLDHARQAGEALEEAYVRLGRRSKWSKWRRDNFKGCRRTATYYRTVAREWSNPRLVEARASGVVFESIRAVIKFLKAPTPSNSEPTPEQLALNAARDELRAAFAEKLRTLTPEEIEVFKNAFDGLWDVLYDELKNRVCETLNRDYYNEPRRYAAARYKRRQEQVANEIKKQLENFYKLEIDLDRVVVVPPHAKKTGGSLAVPLSEQYRTARWQRSRTG